MEETCRKALAEIVSNVEAMKKELEGQLQIEEKTAQDAVAMLFTAGDINEILDRTIASFVSRMSKVHCDVSAQAVATSRLEQLLSTERLSVKDLGASLVESNQTARDALIECAELLAHVEKVSQEKSTLERQVTAFRRR